MPILFLILISSLCFAEVKIKKLSAQDEDVIVLGIDANKNNIRDDLEGFLARNYKKDSEYKAYSNLAESYCLLLKYRKNEKKLRTLHDQLMRDRMCVEETDKSGNTVQNVRSLFVQVFDNRIRQDAYKEAFDTLGGVVTLKQQLPEKNNPLCRKKRLQLSN